MGLLGKKVGMTQIFDQEGAAVPVTVVQLGENIVTQTMNKEKNGYAAVQIGGFTVKAKKLNKGYGPRPQCTRRAAYWQVRGHRETSQARH